jgi:hypothetical protein
MAAEQLSLDWRRGWDGAVFEGDDGIYKLLAIERPVCGAGQVCAVVEVEEVGELGHFASFLRVSWDHGGILVDLPVKSIAHY